MGVIKNRVGEKRYNNQNLLMEIIEYNKAIDITVKFEQSGYICKCKYGNFQRGEVYDKFHPTVCNKGYIGDIKISNKKCYRTWVIMVHRCYDKNAQKIHSTYKDCSVCDEWLCYANFEKWYKENYYEIPNEKMCLDKDILVKYNKIYSPTTCLFVPNTINVIFQNIKNDKNFLGVRYFKERKAYVVYCSNKGKTIYLGLFKTEKEAFLEYKKYKENYIKQIADEYKNKIPINVYNALINYTV